jgi:hypothetical protein
MNNIETALALVAIMVVAVMAAPTAYAGDSQSVELSAFILEPKPGMGIELKWIEADLEDHPGQVGLRITNIGTEHIIITVTVMGGCTACSSNLSTGNDYSISLPEQGEIILLETIISTSQATDAHP